MTEGIIQKILDKYIENSFYPYYPAHESLEELKEELIAEIKKEFPKCHWNGTEWIIQKIIGDNK